MSSIEAAIRGGAFALFVVLGSLLLWRDGRNQPAGRTSGLLAASAAAYVVESAPALSALAPADALWLLPVRLVSMGIPALFWLFSTASFDDDFRPSWQHGLPWLGSVSLGAVCLLGPWPRLWLLYTAITLVLVILACWRAAAGRNTDLIESRRRVRLFVIGVIAAYTIIISIANLRAGQLGQSAPSSLLNAVALLAIAVFLSVTRLMIRNEVLQISPAPPAATTETPTVAPIPPPSPVTPTLVPTPDDETESLALLDRLQTLMAEQKVYREEGLTIAALADRMAIPQYRLRRLINQRLGHRNFSTFVNGYRLAEAMAALADPGQVDVPVLTIALDTGFQSIGPFNRAFKAHTGLTPTDYRRTHQGTLGPEEPA